MEEGTGVGEGQTGVGEGQAGVWTSRIRMLKRMLLWTGTQALASLGQQRASRPGLLGTRSLWEDLGTPLLP